MAEEHIRQEDKIRRVLFNEVTFFIAVIGVVAQGIFWVTNPQQEQQIQIAKLESQVESNETVTAELAKIKNNDLHEVQLRMDRMEDRQLELIQAVARIEALIKSK